MRVLLCFALALTGSGQLARAQIYYLDLSPEQLTAPGRSLYIEQVVDGRNGQPALGVVYRGISDRPAAVMFRQGLEPELTAWLRKQLPQRPTDQPVVLCVRQLRVGETLNGLTQQASADLAVDAYLHRPDGYHYVRSAAARASQLRFDATAGHAPRLAALFQQCLLQLASTNWDQVKLQTPALPLARLARDQPQAGAAAAVLRADAPRRGIYRSFEQFLANLPDTDGLLEVDTVRMRAAGWEGVVLAQPKAYNASRERIPLNTLWGFSDGRQGYIRRGGKCFPLHRLTDFYAFIGPAPLDIEAANRRAENYMTTGVLGAMMTAGPDDTGRPVVFALDMHTGQAAPYPAPGQPPRADTAFVYVYRPAGARPGALPVFLNEREAGQLQPGQYLELACPRFGRKVHLSLGPASPALLLVPDTGTANYIRLEPGPALSPWQYVPPRQGEAEVNALDQERK